MSLIYMLLPNTVIALFFLSVFLVRFGWKSPDRGGLIARIAILALFSPHLYESVLGSTVASGASIVCSVVICSLFMTVTKRKKASHESIMTRFRKAHTELDSLRGGF